MIKKIFIFITSALSLLLFVNPNSVYAQETYYDSDYTSNFAGDSTVKVNQQMVNGNGEMGDGWYLYGSSYYLAVESPSVLLPKNTYLQEVRIPNYTIYRNGVAETQTIERIKLIVKNVTTGSRIKEVVLTNWGPGGQSYFKLSTPQVFDTDVHIFFEIKADTSIVKLNPDSQNPHMLVNMQSTYNVSNWWHYYIEAAFFESIKRSFSPLFLYENQSWIKNSEYYSKVIYRTPVEFLPPNPDDPINPGQFDSINDLPSTAGSIFTNTSGMGRVYFDVDGYKLTTKIEYLDNDYYLDFTMESGTDMSIFNNANKSFYYMYEGEKFILINHGSESIFESSNIAQQRWVGYSIWNLNTNELNTFDKLNVYLYSRLEESNNVYGYFYIDDFVIDRLLSVSLSMRYKYNYIIGQSNWKIHNKILEADVYETFDPTSWQIDVLAGTAIATSVLALIPGVQIPALVIGSAVMAGVGSTIQSDPISFGSINQIQKVTPTGNLLAEINNAYIATNPGFNPNTTSMNMYKLYIGQFNDLWSVGIDIDTDYSLYQSQQGINIIQMSFVKDSQLYVVEGENIDLNFKPGPGTDGQTPGFSFPNLNLSFLISIIGGLIIAVIILVGGIQSGVLYNRYKGFRFSKFLGILFGALLSGALVGLLIYIGVNAVISGGI